MLWLKSSSRVPSALSRLFPETSRLRMVRISRLQGQDGFTANPRSRLGAVPTRGQVALRCIGAQRAEPVLHRARCQPCALVAQGYRVRAAPGCRQPRRGAPRRNVASYRTAHPSGPDYSVRPADPAAREFGLFSGISGRPFGSEVGSVPGSRGALTRLRRDGTQKIGLALGWPSASNGLALGWPSGAGPRLALGWPSAGPRLAGTVLSSASRRAITWRAGGPSTGQTEPSGSWTSNVSYWWVETASRALYLSVERRSSATQSPLAVSTGMAGTMRNQVCNRFGPDVR